MKDKKQTWELLEFNENSYRRKPIYTFIKRTFDMVSAGLALIILSPIFLFIALLIKFTTKGPVLYGHQRIGKKGKAFKVWKFRTMNVDNRPLEEILTPEQLEEYRRDFKITNDPRVSKLGHFLRKSSLDELPQLWNIFIGNMSVVGWRPILQEEVDRYGEQKSLLLKVKPGLTGYWASNGRSDTSYEDRIKLELFYCIKRSTCLDVKIIFYTIIGVFRRDGAK